MESENNATLIDTLSLIFARAAELGALAPQFLTCIYVPTPLNLCDVSTANL